jgi:hypothetical protein
LNGKGNGMSVEAPPQVDS